MVEDGGIADASVALDDAGVDAGWSVPIACGTELPGPALDQGAVEISRDYAAELAARDFSSLRDPFDYSGESALRKALVDYMLGEPRSFFTREQAEHSGPLGRAVVGAAAGDGGTAIDFTFLRRGLHYFYLCSRPVPASLEDFKAQYGDYTTWPTETVECSKPKGGPRRLRENVDAGVFVAETLVDGDTVRETEAIFTTLRTDGSLDFAVYTQDGQLTDRSTFVSGTGRQLTSAAPYTCMTCHYDTAAKTFSRLKPTGTGAGCR